MPVIVNQPGTGKAASGGGAAANPRKGSGRTILLGILVFAVVALVGMKLFGLFSAATAKPIKIDPLEAKIQQEDETTNSANASSSDANGRMDISIPGMTGSQGGAGGGR